MKKITPNASTIETRPLSYMEKFATGWLSPIPHFTFSGKFTEKIIFEAMQKVRFCNPLLRCVIKNRCIVTTSPENSLKEELPISCYRTNNNKNERFMQAARCAYERMGLNMVPENLWHMIFYYNDDGCEMVFQIHHSLFDGMSWFSVARDFLMACEEQFLAIKPLNFALESIYPEHAQAIHGKEPFCVHEWFDITGVNPEIEPIYTGSVLARLPQNVLFELHKHCKDHGITIHAALMAAYLFASNNQLPKLYCDVSTRRWCQPPLEPTSPGVYNGQVVWEAQVNKNQTFWENAIRLLHDMRNLINTGAHLSSSAECSSTSTGPEITCITNMAPPTFPRGSYCLEFSTVELVTGTSLSIPSFPIIFSIMTSNSICNLRLHYHQHFWSCEQAEATLQRLVQILIEDGAQLKSHKVNIFSQPNNTWC